MLVLGGGVLGSIAANKALNANANMQNEALFGDQYLVNEEVEIPDIALDVGGRQVQAQKFVVYPDGRVFQKNSFTPINPEPYQPTPWWERTYYDWWKYQPTITTPDYTFIKKYDNDINTTGQHPRTWDTTTTSIRYNGNEQKEE